MIKLYQYAPAFGLPNASPFCMKVETYLRMAGLAYECPRGANHFKAPKGKLPYIEDNGTCIADSTFIIDYLKATYGDVLDAHLSAPQRALGLVIQRTFEESLYWPVVYARWIDDLGFAKVNAAFFSRLKFPLRQILPIFARRGLRTQLHGQGTGRHSRDEIYAIARRDISALSQLLGDQRYFLGEEPASIDATGYAFLANLLWVPIDLPPRAHALTLPNLEAYCQRMKARYFSITPARR
jgi:glutathione S-transferase